MPSTAKIVLSFIALYIIIGIYNYSGAGSFITPFFLNYYVLIGVGIYSYLINRKDAQSRLLALYSLALISIASSHSLTITTLNRWIGFSESTTIIVPDLYKLISILIFYTVLIYILFRSVPHHQNNQWFWVPFGLLLSSLIAVFMNNNLWQAVLLSLFMLSFVLWSNQFNAKHKHIFTAISFQLVLFLVIENIRFFTTAMY